MHVLLLDRGIFQPSVSPLDNEVCNSATSVDVTLPKTTLGISVTHGASWVWVYEGRFVDPLSTICFCRLVMFFCIDGMCLLLFVVNDTVLLYQ